MSETDRKKQKKAFYRKNANRGSQSGRGILTVGMAGFLFTCNNREKECVRDAYNLLNEYADKKYGPEQFSNKKGEEDIDEAENSEEEDIESALKKEVEGIKSVVKTQRRFTNINSGAKNCVFIKSKLASPQDLVHSILQDVVDNKSSKARFICRMLPVTTSCPARLENILKTVEKVYDEYCAAVGSYEHSFCVSPKIRNQNTLSSNTIKCDISAMIKDKNCLNQVNYNNPELVILIEVIRNVCCVGILRDFFKFRKYNLSELQSHGYGDVKEKRTCEDVDQSEKKETEQVLTEEVSSSEQSLKRKHDVSEDSQACSGLVKKVHKPDGDGNNVNNLGPETAPVGGEHHVLHDETS